MLVSDVVTYVLNQATTNSVDMVGLPFNKLREYLAKTEYKNPQNAMDGPFQYGHQTKSHFFGFLGEHPSILEAFNNHMAGYRQGRPSWMDTNFYPVKDLLAKGLDTGDAVLLVDVGGGLGQDLLEFQSKHPELRGRLILQDQPEVIKQATNLCEAIEEMPHDFFTPQPIIGRSPCIQKDILTMFHIVTRPC